MLNASKIREMRNRLEAAFLYSSGVSSRFKNAGLIKKLSKSSWSFDSLLRAKLSDDCSNSFESSDVCIIFNEFSFIFFSSVEGLAIGDGEGFIVEGKSADFLFCPTAEQPAKTITKIVENKTFNITVIIPGLAVLEPVDCAAPLSSAKYLHPEPHFRER